MIFILGLSISLKTEAIIEDPRDKIIQHLDLESIDIRDALNLLFKNINTPYSVDHAIHGTVTVNLSNQPFESVLRNLLAQVKATYRIQEGTYQVVPKKTDIKAPYHSLGMETPVSSGTSEKKIQIFSADPALIFYLLSQGFTGDWKVTPEISLLTIEAPRGTGGFSSSFGGSNPNSKGDNFSLN